MKHLFIINPAAGSYNRTDDYSAIGLSISTLNNPFVVSRAEGAESAAAKLGAELSVVDAGDDVTKQVSDIEDPRHCQHTAGNNVHPALGGLTRG